MTDKEEEMLVQVWVDWVLANKQANIGKPIRTNQIVVADWVRLKCQYGCKNYGKYCVCPPFTPTPVKTRKILAEYQWALLFGFYDLHSKKEQHNTTLISFEIEREVFLSGLYKAFGFGCGPCHLCGDEPCALEKITNATPTDKKACRHPKQARPSMEACGIDVFATVRKADWEIEVIKTEKECFKSFGLVLLF